MKVYHHPFRRNRGPLAFLLLAALASPAELHSQSNYSTPYLITTLAGNAASGAVDGAGSAARFLAPNGVALDGSGNLFVADTGNNTIRKISPAGLVTTFAGDAGNSGSADATGNAAQFNSPVGVAVDGAGNLYVADTGNNTIRKVSPAGVVTTLAGSASSSGSTDATGSSARFFAPGGVALDGSGNLYVADTNNNTIRKISPAGVVTTLAGAAGSYGSADGTGSAARFTNPAGVAVDGAGNVYVADTGDYTIRKISPAGVVTTLAGAAGSYGSADGTGSAARFTNLNGIAVDASGIVFVGDAYAIRKVTSAGVVTTLAANGAGGNGLAVDGSDNVYAADGYGAIREVNPAGVATVLAGSTAGSDGYADGTGPAARFAGAYGVAVDGSGNVYVADTGNNTIRKITSAGVVTTLAGSAGGSGIGSADGIGSAAQFDLPLGVAVDGSGNVYVTDAGNYLIRRITPSGAVTTLAGTVPNALGAKPVPVDGTGKAARFAELWGIAVDVSGNAYVTDDYTIRKITPGGAVTTLAGAAGVGGSADGTGTTARFNSPSGLAVDGSGNIYVGCSDGTIRKVTPGGVVTTLAGTASVFGSADGTGDAAQFSNIKGVAADAAGMIYVADDSSGRLRPDIGCTTRRITPLGVVTTLAGKAGVQGSADGAGIAARFGYFGGIAADGSGTIYVSDFGNGTIRKGVADEAPYVLAQPVGQTVVAGANAIFSVGASGASPLSYQWNFNGSAIPGATRASYTVTNVQPSNAGSYTVTVANGTGSAASGAAYLTVLPGFPSARLVNISTRAQVGPGANILIPGFVIGGSGTETLLIRADGPGLAQFGVPGALAQPSLSVFDSAGNVIASNTGWGSNPSPDQVASVAASVGAFALAPGSADCALLVSLPAGAYTVEVSGVNNTTGVALAEVYEVSSSGTRLINISTRAQVGTGANIIIPGFVVSGSGLEQLLVRGDGPGLTQFAVPGALAQPSLSVFDNSGKVIASNTAWGTSANPSQISSAAASVGAFPLASGSADSAQIVSLSPGAYTMQISGVNSATGVALAEVYEIP